MKLLVNKYKHLSLNKNLQNWDLIPFNVFVQELKKQKIKLSLNEQAEWIHYFTEEKNKSAELFGQIKLVEANINQMVYELYQLTEEEVKIVEEK